jgi:Ni/Fe-hydrogenase subunit HybB-like protein
MERLGWEEPRRKLNRVLFIFIGIGVLLPSMHQSSLGSLLLVFGPQVNPLYQSQLLPLLFLISCIGMGLAAVVFEGTLSAVALKRPMERELLSKLMGIGTMMMGGFLILRFVDLGIRGALPLAFKPSILALCFWIENLLFATPFLFASKKSRAKPQHLFISACAMAIGGLLYRLSAYLVAYDTGEGWSYFPSLGELAVTIGLIAFEILAITIAIRMLPVLPKLEETKTHG